jgi:hypothetical protein
MELERELTGLAAEIAWPDTPDLAPTLPDRRRAAIAPRRAAVLALALVAVALTAALGVPRSRGAILRFFHLGAVSVSLVDRLPPAEERPLAASLGPTVSRAVAEGQLGAAPLLPPLDPVPPIHTSDHVVSLVFADRGDPVLLSELRAPGGYLLKKLALVETRIEHVRVGRDPGLWLSGGRHVFFGPGGAPPRLAGNVLVWQHGSLTVRLEGRDLTLRRAQALASELR